MSLSKETLAEIENELRSLSRSAADSCRYNERTAVFGKPLSVYLSEVADRIHEAASWQRAIIAELAVVVRTECDGEKHHVTLLADADRIVGGEPPKRPESVQKQGVISDNSAPGNNAAMRAALKAVDRWLSDMLTHCDIRIVGEIVQVPSISCFWILNKVRVALSDPPRNCDRFNGVKDAALAFAREKRDIPHPCPDFTFSTWLFETATERKGEGE